MGTADAAAAGMAASAAAQSARRRLGILRCGLLGRVVEGFVTARRDGGVPLSYVVQAGFEAGENNGRP